MSEYGDMYYVNDTDDNRNGNSKSIVIQNRTGSPLPKKQQGNSIKDFVDFAFRRNYNIARHYGLPKSLALLRANDMTMQQGLESGYGRSRAAIEDNNRSGMMRNGKPIHYATPDLNDIAIYKSIMHNSNWRRGFESPTSDGYFYHLQHPGPDEHAYEEKTKGTNKYRDDIYKAKTLQKMINLFRNSGVTDSWTMNHNMIGLEDMIPLA